MFNLKNYERAIREYSNQENVPYPEAVQRFVQNLLVMRDRFEGFDASINFRTLGQQWNKLTSKIRNQQVSDTLNERSARRRSME